LRERELAFGPLKVVSSGFWKPGFVFFKVRLPDGIGTKPSCELEANALYPAHKIVPLIWADSRSMSQPGCCARLKYAEIEPDLVGLVFTGRIAPTSPSITHFYGDGLMAQRVEVQ
jgi:hypothetical protein